MKTLISDPELQRQLSEALRELRPLSNDYTKALRHLSEASLAEDKAWFGLLDRAMTSTDWHGMLSLLDETSAHRTKAEQYRKDVARLVGPYHAKMREVLDLWTKAVARMTHERSMREGLDDSVQTIEQVLGLDPGTLAGL